jgi:hypothetical protein
MFFATDLVLENVERARIILQCLAEKAVNVFARDLKIRLSWGVEAPLFVLSITEAQIE